MLEFCKTGLRQQLQTAYLINVGYKSPSHYAQDGIHLKSGSISSKATVRATADRPHKTSNMPLPDNAFSSTRIVREVNLQKKLIKDWVYYTYKTDGPTNWTVIRALSCYCYERFMHCTNENMTDKTIEMIKRMVLLALQNARHECLEGTPNWKPAQVRQLTGKKPDNWKKHWAPRWRRLNRIYLELDDQILDKLKHMQ